MGYRRQDRIDIACEQWAAVMRELYGIREPRGFLGPMRCTLGARRDLHHGARSGIVDQRWPAFPFERAPPEAQAIHRAWQRMREPLREIVVANWIPVGVSRSTRAQLMGLSRAEYYGRLTTAKAFLEGALSASE